MLKGEITFFKASSIFKLYNKIIPCHITYHKSYYVSNDYMRKEEAFVYLKNELILNFIWTYTSTCDLQSIGKSIAQENFSKFRCCECNSPCVNLIPPVDKMPLLKIRCICALKESLFPNVSTNFMRSYVNWTKKDKLLFLNC